MRVILLYGPTASGKSERALDWAASRGALVLNADALQVYDGFRALTARPDAEARRAAPHALYGHVDPARADYSVGRWLAEIRDHLAEAEAAGRDAVVVGGTGLYFRALTEGLAEIPPIAPEIRARVAAELAEGGLAAATARLSTVDPETAARVDLANPRRVQRALEILEQTGRGQAAWAAETPAPLVALETAAPIRLVCDRAALRARIRRRLDAMLAAGALEEVAALRARGLGWELPAMKALGARALAEHLEGRLSRADALEQAAFETGRYAKRQDTWGRNQMGAWRVCDADDKAAFKDVS